MLYMTNTYIQYKIEEDQKSKCFICDLESHEFDRRAKVGVNVCKHPRSLMYLPKIVHYN